MPYEIYRRMELLNTQEAFDQLLLPRAPREEFLILVHCGIAGHLDAFKTHAHVRTRVYWFRWRQDVDVYCCKCVRCNEYCRDRAAPKQGRLQPMVTGTLVERWACNLAGPFPTSSRGHVYILTAICIFSKYIVLVPLRDKCATTVV